MPKNNDKQKNIECVLQNAYELFLKYGIENTTKEMLTRASGLSRSSIDRYFKDKTDCVLQTSEWVKFNVRDKNVDVQRFFLEGKHTGIEYLRMYLELVRDLMYLNPQLFVLGAESRMFAYRNNEEDKDTCEKFRMIWGNSALLIKIFECGMEDKSMIEDINPRDEAILTREVLIGFLTSMAISCNKEILQKRNLIDKSIDRMLNYYKR